MADPGAGTGDFVTYKLKDDLSRNSRLDAIHESSGSLCGSQRVNEYILTDIVEKSAAITNAGGLEAFLDELNLSKTLWRKRALAQVEKAKKAYGELGPHYCTVESEGGASDFRFNLNK